MISVHEEFIQAYMSGCDPDIYEQNHYLHVCSAQISQPLFDVFAGSLIRHIQTKILIAALQDTSPNTNKARQFCQINPNTHTHEYSPGGVHLVVAEAALMICFCFCFVHSTQEIIRHFSTYLALCDVVIDSWPERCEQNFRFVRRVNVR